ncbi:MAG: radical SAM family heme chaperone HemW [Deltaproteobacteria bacterium]|nr:radical SAM family heme chaperone HemW [Deltaproteobacteria bacterium]
MNHPGLYIHVPFCRSKCPYCGFYSIVASSLIPRWLDNLKREAARYKELFKESFDSIYLGGGTPSILGIDQLKEIIETIFLVYQFENDTEITIEANPGDINREKAAALKEMGFNRVNVGVQSFNDDELLFLGRRHSVRDAEDSISCLRESGFDNIGLDLIYGLPGQSPDAWKHNLERAVAFEPEHLSCYQLSIETGTAFANRKEKGLIETIGEEAEESFFIATSGFLEGHGYIHYEISNFARGEAFYSRHNRKYWDHTPYLGLGPSAHSFNGRSRWWDIRSVRRYCEAIERDESPIEESEDLTGEQMVMETVSLGLRTIWGFDMNILHRDKELDKVVSMLEESGYIHVRDGRIIPSEKGFLIADQLPLYFFK